MTGDRDLAERGYVPNACVRDGGLRGLLAVCDVDPTDLAADPRSEPEERTYRLRRTVRPVRIEAVAVHSQTRDEAARWLRTGR